MSAAQSHRSSAACYFMVDLLGRNRTRRYPHDQLAIERGPSPWGKPELF